MAMGLFTTRAFAQEVRGVETRRAIYEGEIYKLEYSNSRGNLTEFGTSSEYYGFEFTNLNSIPVSVSIEVYSKGSDSDRLIGTKEIVLESKEKYVYKDLTLKRYMEYYDSYHGSCRYANSDTENWNIAKKNGEYNANNYYVKYKAYKLQ